MDSIINKKIPTLAYYNGQIIPSEQMQLSVYDQGFVHGASITEMVRTFQGNYFEMESHLKRFENSARLCHIPLKPTRENIRIQAIQLLAEQKKQADYPEWGLILSATPGLNPTYTGSVDPTPTFYMHLFPIRGHLWSKATLSGLHLAISTVIHTPDESLPVQAKSRSRMNWYLADREVALRFPDARALLLDQYGFVRETSTANLFAIRNGQLLTPPENQVLPGISRQVTLELARINRIPFTERPLSVDDLLQAEEIFCTSTPYGLLGVSRLNGVAVRTQFPGVLTQRLIQLWSEHVGLDIHAQLRELAGDHH